MDFVLLGAIESPTIFDAFAGASLVKAGHLASEEKCHSEFIFNYYKQMY